MRTNGSKSEHQMGKVRSMRGESVLGTKAVLHAYSCIGTKIRIIPAALDIDRGINRRYNPDDIAAAKRAVGDSTKSSIGVYDIQASLKQAIQSAVKVTANTSDVPF